MQLILTHLVQVIVVAFIAVMSIDFVAGINSYNTDDTQNTVAAEEKAPVLPSVEIKDAHKATMVAANLEEIVNAADLVQNQELQMPLIDTNGDSQEQLEVVVAADPVPVEEEVYQEKSKDFAVVTVEQIKSLKLTQAAAIAKPLGIPRKKSSVKKNLNVLIDDILEVFHESPELVAEAFAIIQ